MNVFARISILAPIVLSVLAGCGTTQDVAATSYHVTRDAAVGSYKVARAVAVGSYRVASTPVHYATRKIGGDSSTTVGTETPSDVSTPGEPIAPEVPTASQQQAQGAPGPRQTRRTGETSVVSRSQTTESSSSRGSSQAAAPTTTFPTGKLVPGKPGYVFSPFDKEGRYVDVSGFPSGTKVKDPWTDKIFLVP